MKLIIGGGYQRKMEYALSLIGDREIEIAEGENCTMEEVCKKPLIHNFHQFLRRMIEEEKDLESVIKFILKANPDVMIVTDEIGSGIVPVDEFDRMAREQTGRACCMLAKEAEEVHRVIAGIGMKIKG